MCDQSSGWGYFFMKLNEPIKPLFHLAKFTFNFPMVRKNKRRIMGNNEMWGEDKVLGGRDSDLLPCSAAIDPYI